MPRSTKTVWFLVVPRTGVLDIAGPWGRMDAFGRARTAALNNETMH